jgi:hypothetical protein
MIRNVRPSSFAGTARLLTGFGRPAVSDIQAGASIRHSIGTSPTSGADHLARTKRKGLSEYGTVASVYVDEFNQKWVSGGAEGKEILGTADIQSLTDMVNSYQVVSQMRIVPFALTDVARLAVVTLLPILPLLLTIMPLEELLTRFLKVIL